jgi:DNA-binding CsgD family transcriptional regulator
VRPPKFGSGSREPIWRASPYDFGRSGLTDGKPESKVTGSESAGNRGLEAFERRAWAQAFAAFREDDAGGRLTAEELERFAIVAQLVGEDEESPRLWERAHQAWLQCADPAGSARCAFWLGLALMERGELSRAGGWLARAQRVLEQSDVDCPERAYLRIPEGLQQLESGDAAAARELFEEIASEGQRFAEADLAALGRLGRGQALVRLGDTAEGATQLDEVMVAVTTGELSPLVAGIVYCAVIEACQEMFDLRRAQEWTAALSDWCDSQPDLVPFRGRCLVYRAEILQLRGAWPEAAIEAQKAFEQLSTPRAQPAVGAAYYCQGELHRLRGALSDADEAFRRAGEWGRRPEPGLALLRLAQGRPDAAATAIRHALDETDEPTLRAPLLAAAVEILLATGDAAGPEKASLELQAIADQIGAPLLSATAARAMGAVAFASGDARSAATELGEALANWLVIDAPYEAARTRVLLADALRALGDEEAAASELEAAHQVFEHLGAGIELRLLGADAQGDAAAHGLTPREAEVLSLVATGMTNRAIAANLTISEKTVARHLSNIFGKLGVGSRSAATAYAYEHDLV